MEITIQEIERTLNKMAKEAAENWFRMQSQNIYGHYYVFYMPSTETEWGKIQVAENAPEGYKLADPRRITRDKTVEQAEYFIRQIMRGLPLIPWA